MTINHNILHSSHINCEASLDVIGVTGGDGGDDGDDMMILNESQICDLLMTTI